MARHQAPKHGIFGSWRFFWCISTYEHFHRGLLTVQGDGISLYSLIKKEKTMGYLVLLFVIICIKIDVSIVIIW